MNVLHTHTPSVLAGSHGDMNSKKLFTSFIHYILCACHYLFSYVGSLLMYLICQS